VSELREKLAKRLGEVVYESFMSGAGVRERMTAREAAKAHDLALADECIRQMEWARRSVSISGPMTIESSELRLGEIVPTTKIVSPARIRLGDLTIAPDGWKPKED